MVDSERRNGVRGSLSRCGQCRLNFARIESKIYLADSQVVTRAAVSVALRPIKGPT
jgi:hypothetical protein